MTKKIELRAVPELEEQRNALLDEMETIVNGATTETRAMTETESTRFDAITKEIAAIDKTISAKAATRSMTKSAPAKTEETSEQIEERSFANYVRSASGVPIETRTGEQNLTMANNGAVIPTTIANRIISTVKNICPIFAKATIYNVKGTLKVPVYGKSNTTHDIAVAYQAEFTDITADVGKFTSVDLSGFLVGALALIGKSVVNSADIDVVSFIVNEMSKAIAIWLSKELLNGTADKMTGALSTTTNLMAGSVSAISADNLIDLQAKVPQVYQANACWTMAPDTFTGVRKLKDGSGKYLVQDNFSQDFPYMILGKPVYLDDNMPAIASAAKAVLYGDYSGLSVNFREGISIQILNEKYATQHAIGAVAWFEADSDVTDNQKLATLTMSVS